MSYKLIKTNKGFTLIETLIYMALFAIMIGGLFISVLQIFYNTHDLKSNVIVEEEANFVLRKLEWILNDMTDINSASGSNLSIDNSDGTVTISKVDTKIEVCISGDCEDITSANVKVENLTFNEIPQAGGSPPGVYAEIIINGQTVGIKKHIRI